MKLFIYVSFLIMATVIYTVQSITHLDNKRIKKFDDKKIGQIHVGIDGALIHDMLWVIDVINSIQHGSRQHNTEHSLKLYTFEGTSYSLDQLRRKEAEEEKKDFSAVVEHIKTDFHNTVTHFMQQLIVKTVICNAIEEWCDKSDRPESVLKRWAKTNKEEFESIYHHITTAADLHTFLTDLKEFLTDVINSCPRAWNEFLEHQDEYAAQTQLKKYDA
jgi:hypothetical protein